MLTFCAKIAKFRGRPRCGLLREMSEQGEDPFDWVGATLDGKYQVDAVVGRGGFGVVYRAHHLGFNENVAVKCLRIPQTLSGAARDEFADEGDAAPPGVADAAAHVKAQVHLLEIAMKWERHAEQAGAKARVRALDLP